MTLKILPANNDNTADNMNLCIILEILSLQCLSILVDVFFPYEWLTMIYKTKNKTHFKHRLFNARDIVNTFAS